MAAHSITVSKRSVRVGKVCAQKCGTSVRGGCAQFVTDPCNEGGQKPFMHDVDAVLGNVMTAAKIKDLKVKSDQRIKELYTNSPSPLHRRISGTWQGSILTVLGKGLGVGLQWLNAVR